jgi:DNA-binding LytR/AlgR family response regulator
MRVVIVEDEIVVARRLERLVREALGEALEHVDLCIDLGVAVKALDRGEGAVLLLDLDLGGRDGFELLRRAVAEPFQTVVVSANTDRAVEAFELGVVDFVPKPFTLERIAKALQRVRNGRREARAAYLAVTLAGRVDLVAVDSVLAIHGADDYSELETADGGRHLHKKTLSQLESLLPPEFARVHRSHIVNLRHAKGLASESGARRVVILSNGTAVPVGRAYGERLRKRML